MFQCLDIKRVDHPKHCQIPNFFSHSSTNGGLYACVEPHSYMIQYAQKRSSKYTAFSLK